MLRLIPARRYDVLSQQEISAEEGWDGNSLQKEREMVKFTGMQYLGGVHPRNRNRAIVIL